MKNDIFRRLCMSFVISLCLHRFSYNQERFSPPAVHNDSSHYVVHPGLAIGALVVSSTAVVHVTRYLPLEDQYKTRFFIRENYQDALQQEKFLHFFGSSFISHTVGTIMEWNGCGEREAAWYGMLASSTIMTVQKVEDGYVSYLGFDRVVAMTNIAGAAYPVLQSYVPVLKNFSLKMSYQNSHTTATVEGQVQQGMVNDREGQRFWIGITVHDLLPQPIQHYWPPMLGVAVGTSVSDLHTGSASRALYVALDLDLRKLPGDSMVLKRIWELLNFIHLPMPAVRLMPSAVWYGLYF